MRGSTKAFLLKVESKMTASNLATVNPTMSSREIAELTGKQHQHVKRGIENMLKELKEDVSTFGRIYLDARNREQTEYALDRELTETLLTGYSAELRRRVVRRLRELELAEGARQLTNAEIKRIERDYAENLKHHPNYELGEALKRAIRMEDYDNVAELEGILDKLDFEPAARSQGLPVEVVRRQVAAHTAATLMLQSMRRGEEPHDSPVTGVVQWARASVKAEDTKAKMIAYQKARERQPQTLEQIVSHDLAHKHD